jgi:hypothetical protein
VINQVASMKKEYEEKLEMARKLIVGNDFSCEEEREKILQGFRIIESLVVTLDTEILRELFDFFITETENEYKVCETLEGLVFDHFTSDQFLQVYYQKFDSLAEKNPERCASIAGANFFYQDENDIKFEELRKMFNAIKSQHSGKFLKELKSLLLAGPCIDKFYMVKKVRVYTLEEDMKKW